MAFSQGVASLQAATRSDELLALIAEESTPELQNGSAAGKNPTDDRIQEQRKIALQNLIQPSTSHELYSRFSSSTSQQTALAAQLVLEAAEIQTELAERIRYMCRSLELYEVALHKSPFASSQLINWVNLRQLLGDTQCEGQDSTMRENTDYRDAVALAITAEPSNPRILFAAGLMAARGGDRDQALALFNSVLNTQVGRVTAHESAMLSQIQTGNDVLRLIPARFPQVAIWSQLLVEQQRREQRAVEVLGNSDEGSIRQALSRLQLNAIEASRKELEAAEITAFVHSDRLVSLSTLALHDSALILGDQVRGAVDRELLRLLDEERVALNLAPETRATITRRAGLESIAVLKTTLASDTRANKSPLVNWEVSQNLWFDEFYRTVGFYLPPEASVSLIELVGYGSLRELSPATIEIFGSADNQSWEVVKPATEILKSTLGMSALLSIPVAKQSYRYWKVNYASAARQRRFQGELQSMLRVYGPASSGADPTTKMVQREVAQ